MPNQDVLLSVRPHFASRIMTGEKTVELRRRFPELVSAKAFFYSSSPVQAVVGYAMITSVHRLAVSTIWRSYAVAACISKREFDVYFTGLKYGFVLSLGRPRSVKTRIDFAALREEFGITPPQSYRYLQADCARALSHGNIQAPIGHERRNRT